MYCKYSSCLFYLRLQVQVILLRWKSIFYQADLAKGAALQYTKMQDVKHKARMKYETARQLDLSSY